MDITEDVIWMLLQNGAADVSDPVRANQSILYQIVDEITNLIINLSNLNNWTLSSGKPNVDKIYWSGLPSTEILYYVRRHRGNVNYQELFECDFKYYYFRYETDIKNRNDYEKPGFRPVKTLEEAVQTALTYEEGGIYFSYYAGRARGSVLSIPKSDYLKTSEFSNWSMWQIRDEIERLIIARLS